LALIEAAKRELPAESMAMRWNDLFADLEAQASRLAERDRSSEVAGLVRAEVGRIGLIDRLRPSVGAHVGVHCLGGLRVEGRLDQVGPDWLLVAEGGGRETVLPSAAVTTINGLIRLSGTVGSAVEARLGLASALRAVARDRSAVGIHATDGRLLSGTIDRVGRDFLEVASHAAGELRRRADVRGVLVVPFSALAAVRRLREE
jgi:hypothetical protein